MEGRRWKPPPLVPVRALVSLPAGRPPGIDRDSVQTRVPGPLVPARTLGHSTAPVFRRRRPRRVWPVRSLTGSWPIRPASAQGDPHGPNTKAAEADAAAVREQRSVAGLLDRR